MRGFVDTSFLIALIDKSDKYFNDAQDCFKAQVSSGTVLLTSNLVLAETLTWLRYHAGFRYAKEFGEKFRHSKIIKTIWVDQELERTAWEIFLKYSDQSLSYVDCFSFACMRVDKIDLALTFDRHFQQVGFNVIPQK
ncbi:VapC toxin family PIN domain ribonuclease [Candidatus Saganbacteria bacterium CG08_land_8_20_14_0_20_45_16]|uniref:VapC toxin family PIN domain ribonuclease n=1 Tax=Candidatus Saganbacteria bacterium CG08_land_8_20_14_0_20_45_16 TaxID=2014293 RepID=A0A2H0XUM9_UNCSA|nr:MAG: VapC toxin family PIN domain ribonuclease [Candidatus Saganbacteria bacterium CG08_land_8_20_14_0_20_45_16]